MLQNIIPFLNKYLKNRVHITLTLNSDNFFNFGDFHEIFTKMQGFMFEIEIRQKAALEGQRGSRKGQEGQPAPPYRASCSTADYSPCIFINFRLQPMYFINFRLQPMYFYRLQITAPVFLSKSDPMLS